jgi:hypothetical protein
LNLIRVMPAKGQDIVMNATSRTLARLIGPVALAMGAYILFNAAIFRVMVGQFLASYALIFLAGLLTLTAGLAIVLAHNVWTRDWRVIITVLGWLAVIGGVLRIVFPQFVVSIGGAIFAQAAALPAIGVGVVILGAVLSYFGYRNA